MSSETRDSSARPLRLRTTNWIVLAMWLALLGCWLSCHLATRSALLAEVDDTLLATAATLVKSYESANHDFIRLAEQFEQEMPVPKSQTLFAALLDVHGSPLILTEHAPRPLPMLPHAIMGRAVNMGNIRVLEVAVAPGRTAPYSVLVGVHPLKYASVLSRFDWLSLPWLFLLCCSVPGVAYWMSGFISAPAEELARSAVNISTNVAQTRLAITSNTTEVERLSEIINKLLDRIHIDEEGTRQLLADAAHQLRTPLAAIRSSVEVALGGAQSPASYEELLAQVIDESESLETLVNQLLLLTESETVSTPHARDNVSLDSLVRKSVDMFEPVAEMRGVSLWLGTLARAEVRGNRHHLRQVINNLLENSIKFTAVKSATEKRSIRVELMANPREHTVQLRVKDTGIGIDQEHLPRVFDRFYRADAGRTRELGVSGNGLGLSIVKTVAEAHGGSVSVQSEFGKGTTFIVTLPLSLHEEDIEYSSASNTSEH